LPRWSEISRLLCTRRMDDEYDEGYWERGEGSNYQSYGDDPGWMKTAAVMNRYKVGTLLEIGCAKGFFIGHAEHYGYDAIGIDLSQWAIDHSVRPDQTFLRDITGPITWKQEFDVVCSWELLEHIPAELLPAVFANIKTAMAPGALTFHRIGMLLEGEDHASLEDDKTHVTIENREWWEARFQEQGFTRRTEIEDWFDKEFDHRDWKGRFIVCELP